MDLLKFLLTFENKIREIKTVMFSQEKKRPSCLGPYAQKMTLAYSRIFHTLYNSTKFVKTDATVRK